MKLLLTRVIRLTQDQIDYLKSDNELYFFGKESEPLENYPDIPYDEIEGIVSYQFLVNHNLKLFPKLKFIQLMSVGTDWVDLNYCKENNIMVYNVGSAFAIPMAEWCIGKIFEIYKKTFTFYNQQKNHEWVQRRGVLELNDKTVLLFGFGNIVKETAKRLKAFGVKIVICNRSIVPIGELCDEYYSLQNKEFALKKADIVILAIPATKDTIHIISKNELSVMKDSAVIVNVGRGALIDEVELINTLQSGKLLGVALDVFEKEPLLNDNPLWDMPNVIVTPHTCFMGDGNDNRKFETLKYNLSLL